MKGNKYLVKRGDKFYFRMPLNRELSLILGRCEIKRSLKTNDKPRAILKGSLYYYFTKKLLNIITMTDTTTYSIEEAKNLARIWFNNEYQKFEEEIAQEGLLIVQPNDDEELYQEVGSIHADRYYEEALKLKTKLDKGNYSDEDTKKVTDLITSLQAQSPEDKRSMNNLRYARTYVEFNLKMFKCFMYAGNHAEAKKHIQELQTTSASVLSTGNVLANDKSLKWMVDTFMNELQVRVDENQIRVGSITEYRTAFNFLLEFYGDNARLTKEMAGQMKEILLKMPTNRKKKAEFKDLTVLQLLELEIPKENLLSTKTINKHIGKLHTFSSWAINHGYSSLAKSPFENTKLKESSKKSAKEKRLPFSDESLHLIFNNDIWLAPTRKDSYKYWTPLLSLFTGARVNEIAQLCVDDVEHSNGIYTISIHEKNEHNRIKTDHAERVIPLHPYIIELGFIEYVNSLELNSNGLTRLFPDLTLHERNGFARKITRWFSDYKTELGFEKTKESFHSFRHTFMDYFTNKVHIDDGRTDYIQGHAPKTERRQTYGNRPSTEILHEVILKIDYSSVLPDIKMYPID